MTNTPRLVDQRVSWTFLAGFVTVSLLYVAGWFDEAIYSVLLTGTVVSIVIGVRRNQPARQWHWWAFIAATLLWAVAGIVRDSVHATGVTTSARSLLPDVFALPAYGVVAVGLTALLRSRDQHDHSPNAWLDGAVISLGALLLAFVVALGPTLSDEHAWLPAQIAIAIYPPLSALLATIAFRLAFGTANRSASHQMVFVGTLCLLAGDTLFAMEEVGTLSVGRVYELPFLLASALFGAAALHPSMRHLGKADARRDGGLTHARVVMIAIALLMPALVVELSPWASPAARWFLLANLVLLALAATARLLFTVRAQSETEARLIRQATHDELTGLPNRTYAVAHIEERLRRNEQSGGSLAVMFADVDRFKLINDSMGHAVGDELLVAAANRLLGAVRAGDVVARISGDEFLVICDQVDVASARVLSHRIRAAFNEGFDLTTGRLHATASVGIAVSDPYDLADAPALIRDADTAMYESKLNGRGSTTFFDVQMRQRVERRVLLEREMRTALEAHELIPHFQPIVCLPSGQIVGFEALARWPIAGGYVSPVEFIPVAEESGLIVPLGATILDQACAQLAAWREELPGAQHAYVSVNLSPRQVLESDIVDTVADTLDRWGLPGSALTLEITESVMMEDTLETQAVLNALCGLGVSLSVDDFGTGFSSLSYLKRFPITRVKIDKAFVDGLDDAGSDDSLVVAILAMADALRLTAVAEGVERHSQADRLFELGCADAQGYYFARPLTPADVPGIAGRLGFAPAHGSRIG